jgi:very-short-patch-repair endonuclease
MANKQARYLRRNMTLQEVKLWVHLRAWRANGFHFRRQAPRDRYIVDFACLKRGLIVELDGSGHGHHYQILRDQERDRRLGYAGFRVLRFWNNDVDANLPGVLDAIHAALEVAETPPTALRAVPPPRSGEG